MKIAVLGILGENLSAQAEIGGVGAFNLDLINELRKRGHEVTIFNINDAGHNKINAYLEKDYLENANKKTFTRESGLFRVMQFADFLKRQTEFDLVHVSTFEWYYFLPFISLLKIPHLITVHSQIVSSKVLKILVEKYSDANLVFISRNQMQSFPKNKNSKIIYNGVNLSKLKFNAKSKDYLTWLGRINPDKGLDTALAVASDVGKKIIFAGSGSESLYFEELMQKHPASDEIQFLGKVGLKGKIKLLGEAKVLLFPIHWDEPFGLVPIEAMACGTPVIAYNRGSMSEIIVPGKNGFLCKPDNLKEMEDLVLKIFAMKESEYNKLRQSCKDFVEENFTIERMVDNYINFYTELLNNFSIK